LRVFLPFSSHRPSFHPFVAIYSERLPPVRCNVLGAFVAVLQEIARLAAEEAAKRAAEQLARLKTAKAAAEEAAAAAPPEEEAQEDEPSAGASAGKSPRKSSKSPGRNERAKSPKCAKKKGKKELV
jgi:hypothetical protein